MELVDVVAAPGVDADRAARARGVGRGRVGAPDRARDRRRRRARGGRARRPRPRLRRTSPGAASRRRSTASRCASGRADFVGAVPAELAAAAARGGRPAAHTLGVRRVGRRGARRVASSPTRVKPTSRGGDRRAARRSASTTVMVTGDRRATRATRSRPQVGIDRRRRRGAARARRSTSVARPPGRGPAGRGRRRRRQRRARRSRRPTSASRSAPGTDVAIEASDLTLVSGDLRGAADAIALSRRDARDDQGQPVLGVRLQRRRDPARRGRPAQPGDRRGGDGVLVGVRGDELAAAAAVPRRRAEPRRVAPVGYAGEALVEQRRPARPRSPRGRRRSPARPCRRRAASCTFSVPVSVRVRAVGRPRRCSVVVAARQQSAVVVGEDLALRAVRGEVERRRRRPT